MRAHNAISRNRGMVISSLPPAAKRPAGLGWNSRRTMQQRPEAPKCRLTSMR